MLFSRVDDGIHWLFDTDIDNVVAVVGQDDVDQILADVVNIALHRGQHDGAFTLVIGFLDVRLQMGNGGFHGFGTGQDEWQLHLTGTEKLSNCSHSR